MSLCIPHGAEYLTVTFACPGGGEHNQRIDATAVRGGCLGKVIAHAVRSAKRRKVRVANCLRISHRDAVLYEAAGFLPGGFCR